MFKKFNFIKELSKEEELQEYLFNANKVSKKALERELKELDISGYEYSTEEAIEGLGLDDEMIQDLVEDFVTQIIKYKPLFLMYIDELRKREKNSQTLDYTNLRELAHKNLGVARNLRIEDAQKILHELMSKDDLNYLEVCANALEACLIQLKPEIAFKTSKLIEIKIYL